MRYFWLVLLGGVLLSGQVKAAENEPETLMASAPSRLEHPHHVSLSLDWPRIVSLNYRYQIFDHWALGPYLSPFAYGISSRHYFSPELSSTFWELVPAYHPNSLFYGIGGSMYSLNARYGWEGRTEVGLTASVFAGLGLALVKEYYLWGMVNVGGEIGYAF